MAVRSASPIRLRRLQNGQGLGDPAHPLTRQLLRVIAGGVTLLGQAPARSLPVYPGPNGVGVYNPGSPAGFPIGKTTLQPSGGGPFTIILRIDAPANATGSLPYAIVGVNPLYLLVNRDLGFANNPGMISLGNGISGLQVAGTLDGLPHTFVFTYSGTTISCYRDGVLLGTSGSFPHNNSPSNQEYIGGHSSAGYGNVDYGIQLLATSNTELSLPQIQSISRSTWDANAPVLPWQRNLLLKERYFTVSDTQTKKASPPIPVRGQRSTQPQASARPNPRLKPSAAWVGSLPFDVVSSLPITRTSSLSVSNNPSGRAYKVAGTSTLGRVVLNCGAADKPGAGDFTAVIRFVPTTVAAPIYVLGRWNTGASPGTNDWLLLIDLGGTGTTQFMVECGLTVYTASTPVAGIVAGNEYTFVARRKGTTISVFRFNSSGDHSMLTGSTTNAGITTINSNGARSLRLGEIDTAAGLNGDMAASHVGLFPRALTDGEIKALERNPHTLFDVDAPPASSLFSIAQGRDPISVLGSRLLQATGPAPSLVAPIALNTKIPRILQPQRRPQINRSTPAGKAITTLIPFGVVNEDLVSGAKVTFGAGGSIRLGARGLSLRGDGSAAAASIPLNLSNFHTISLSFWMNWDNYLTEVVGMEFTSQFTVTQGGFLINPPSGSPFPGQFQVGVNGLGRAFTRPSAGVWHHFVFTLTMGSGSADITQAFVDSIPQSFSTIAGTGLGGTAFANNTLYLFSRAGSTLIGKGDLQNLVIRGNYVVTLPEVQAEYNKPWELYTPSSGSIWGGR